jgi:hypothetical protein
LEGGTLHDDLKNLDLSCKSFEEFVEFFFNRAVVPDKEQFDYFLTDLAGERYDEAVPSSPEVLVGQLAKLFSQFQETASRYSKAQVDQAVWGILGGRLRLHEYLFDVSVPLPGRLKCIRSMY